MKKCNNCENLLPVSEFYKRTTSKDGLQHQCKSCTKERVKNDPKQKQRQKNWYKNNTEREKTRAVEYKRKRKRELVEKLGGKCEICGYDKCYRALTFHHLDPSNKVRKNRGFTSQTLQTIEQEIKDCLLLCANCHMEVEDKIITI
jgi:DNA-directed RNA polymerase subunit M/transcription elongation factor TFIIS